MNTLIDQVEEGADNPDCDTIPVVIQQEVCVYSFAKCKLCMDAFNLPVTLPCAHSFCKDCLSNYWTIDGDTMTEIVGSKDKQRNICCPTCYASCKGFHTRLAVNHFLEVLLAINAHLLKADEEPLLNKIMRLFPIQTGPSSPEFSVNDLLMAIGNTSVSEQDVHRLGVHIQKLKRLYEEILSKRKYIKESLLSNGLDSNTIITSPEDAGILVGNEVMVKASSRFKIGSKNGLPRSCYNCILINANPDMMMSEKGVRALTQLPIFGLAAANSIVIVKTNGAFIDLVINDMFNQWGVSFGTILAVWTEDKNATETRRTSVLRTHFFVGGTIGTLQLMSQRNTQGRCANFKTMPTTKNDIPDSVLNSLATLSGSCNVRCMLFSNQPHNLWDTCIPTEDDSDDE